MRIFKIDIATHRGKQIQITRYVKTATGVAIEITHNVPSVAGKQLACMHLIITQISIKRSLRQF